jgi:hypothetical protein
MREIQDFKDALSLKITINLFGGFNEKKDAHNYSLKFPDNNRRSNFQLYPNSPI